MADGDATSATDTAAAPPSAPDGVVPGAAADLSLLRDLVSVDATAGDAQAILAALQKRALALLSANTSTSPDKPPAAPDTSPAAGGDDKHASDALANDAAPGADTDAAAVQSPAPPDDPRPASSAPRVEEHTRLHGDGGEASKPQETVLPPPPEFGAATVPDTPAPSTPMQDATRLRVPEVVQTPAAQPPAVAAGGGGGGGSTTGSTPVWLQPQAHTVSPPPGSAMLHHAAQSAPPVLPPSDGDLLSSPVRRPRHSRADRLTEQLLEEVARRRQAEAKVCVCVCVCVCVFVACLNSQPWCAHVCFRGRARSRNWRRRCSLHWASKRLTTCPKPHQV